MPKTTILEISAAQQEWMLRELRRGRYGGLLALHILLLLADGKRPPEIADFLRCSRSSVYRAIEDWQSGKLPAQWWPEPPAATPAAAHLPSRFQRTLLWLVQQPPRVGGWCRVRWSCVTLALTITRRTGVSVSRETVRRELHAQGWGWKRAKLKGRDDDPERHRKLARIRAVLERLRADEAFFWIDELDIHLLAKVGYQWMPEGTQLAVPTPGQNQKQYLAGALDWRTGEISYVIGTGKNNGLVRQLLEVLEQRCGSRIRKIYLGLDNYKIHKALALEQWLKEHPRFERLWLPSYCPQSNPIERAFGDVHDKWTRNHMRKTLYWVIYDVRQHLQKNGPWDYQLPSIYYESEVEAELHKLYLECSSGIAA